MGDVNKRQIQKGSYYKLLLPYIIILSDRLAYKLSVANETEN
jgi:hypothetical protein